jgi:hypothetical protein
MTQPSPAALWTGRVLTGLFALFMLGASIAPKLLNLPVTHETMAQLGWPTGYVLMIGLIELACVVLYLIPRTALLGAVLTMSLLGGAMATQIRIGNPRQQPLRSSIHRRLRTNRSGRSTLRTFSDKEANHSVTPQIGASSRRALTSLQPCRAEPFAQAQIDRAAPDAGVLDIESEALRTIDERRPLVEEVGRAEARSEPVQPRATAARRVAQLQVSDGLAGDRTAYDARIDIFVA